MALISFTGRGRLPLIRQTEPAECGLACLAMVALFHGYRIDLNTLRRPFPVSLNGVTLRALMQVAGQMQLESRLKCPRCGSRDVRLLYDVPTIPGRARDP